MSLTEGELIVTSKETHGDMAEDLFIHEASSQTSTDTIQPHKLLLLKYQTT